MEEADYLKIKFKGYDSPFYYPTRMQLDRSLSNR